MTVLPKNYVLHTQNTYCHGCPCGNVTTTAANAEALRNCLLVNTFFNNLFTPFHLLSIILLTYNPIHEAFL